MKKTTLLTLMLSFLITFAFSQINFDTLSATYTVGDIASDHDFISTGDVSSCPGTLNVPVPNNSLVYSVNVHYTMTAIAPQTMAQQRSQIWCTSPSGTKEPEVIFGSGYSAGTIVYDRPGLNIAYGIKPIFGLGVNFQLHAGTYYYNQVDCSTAGNKIDNNSWTVTVIYLPAGSPGFPSLPTPVNNQLLVGVNNNLSWTFGTSSNTYDVYFGTTNPPTTKVVNNASVSGSTGTFDPGTMASSETYYWQVVAKNAVNNTPGPVWSFSTACNTIYPYFENFDGVLAPALPACWVPLSSSSSPYTKVETNSSYNQARSEPNCIIFNASAEPSPNIVLVLPEAGTINNKMITLYGKNASDGAGGFYSWPIQIGTMSDPFNISTFTPFDSFIPAGTWTFHETYFNTYSGTNTYIAIKGAIPQYNVIYVDDVTLDIIPDCIKPLNVTASNIQAQQATLSWTDMNGASSWNVEYGVSPYTPTGTPTITGVSNPCIITNLASGTYYDIYVQTNCGGEGLSIWSLPITILTKCLPMNVPISEDFGIATVNPTWPLCWSHISINSEPTGGVAVSSYNALSGNGVRMEPAGDAAAEMILISPPLSPAVSTLKATFWARSYSGTDQNALLVGTITDTTNAASFTALQTIAVSNVHQLYTVYFDDYSGSDIYIAWRHNSNDFPTNDVFIDDVLIEAIPSCVEPYEPWLPI